MTTTSQVCPSCKRAMVLVGSFTFTDDEPAVRRFKRAGIEIAGDVQEWACAPCDERLFVWPTR
jgi:hypothetical protein